MLENDWIKIEKNKVCVSNKEVFANDIFILNNVMRQCISIGETYNPDENTLARVYIGNISDKANEEVKIKIREFYQSLLNYCRDDSNLGNNSSYICLTSGSLSDFPKNNS